MGVDLIKEGIPANLECNLGFAKKLIGLGGSVSRIMYVKLKLNCLESDFSLHLIGLVKILVLDYKQYLRGLPIVKGI
jgi:hypothetical protein